MSTPIPESLNNALIDAQLVIDYSARAGLMNENNKLVVELENAKLAIANNQTPSVASLFHALSESLNAIKEYTSMVELRSGYSPFSWCYRKISPDANPATVTTRFISFKVGLSKILPLIFLVGTLFATFMFMDRMRNDLSLLKTIDTIEKANSDKLIRKIIGEIRGNALSKTNVNSYLEYSDNIDQLSQVSRTADFFGKQVVDFEVAWKKNIFFNIFLPTLSQTAEDLTKNTPGQLKITSSETNSSGESPDTTKAAASIASGASSAEPPYVKQWREKLENPAKKDIQKASSPPPIEPVKGFQYTIDELSKNAELCDQIKNRYETSAGAVKASLNANYSQCLEQSLGLMTIRAQIKSATDAASPYRQELYRLTAWILPLTVGFLGASIFLLFLKDSRKSFVPLLFIIRRFALGGVAGIIIAWFYAPAHISSSDFDLLDSAKQFPFLFAFLAGFGSDSVFLYLTKKAESIGNNETAKS